MAVRSGQREIKRGRRRLSPGDPPRPRRWIPRDSQPGRKSTTAPGAGKRRELRLLYPRPGPASAQLPEPRRRSHPQPCPVRPAAVAAAAPTCAAAGTVRDGSRSLPAAKHRARRAELVERLRLPGRGQAKHAAAAAAGLLPPGARGAQPGPPLALSSRGQLAVSPSPGAAPRFPAAPGPASPSPPALRPCPPRARGPRGLGRRSPQSHLLVARSFPGFPCGVACPACLDSRAGWRWPRAGTRW